MSPRVLADTVFGRYNTILIFSMVCLAGHIILIGTASPASLANPNGAVAGLIVSICKSKLSQAWIDDLTVHLYTVVMGLGAGAIKANVSALIAEQYKGVLRKETLPSGEVIIKSPALTVQSIYMCMHSLPI